MSCFKRNTRTLRFEEAEFQPLQSDVHIMESGISPQSRNTTSASGDGNAGTRDCRDTGGVRSCLGQFAERVGDVGNRVMKINFWKHSFLSRFPRTLRLLLWKNVWLLAMKRHYIFSLLQIGLPLIFTIIAAIVNAGFSPNEADLNNITFFHTMDEKELVQRLYNQTECPICVVAYEPKTDLTERIVSKLHNLCDGFLEDGHELKDWNGFTSELEMEAYWHSHLENGSVELKAAILFHDGFNVSTNFKYEDDHNFSYTIRIPALVDTIDFIPGLLPHTTNEDAGDTHHITAAALQILINKVLTEELTQDGFPQEKILLQPFPRITAPITNSHVFGRYFNTLGPVLLSLGFVSIVPSIVGAIVREKESGIRELMQVHGLSNFVNWLGWLLHSIIMLGITVMAVLVLLFLPMNSVIGGIIKRGSFSLWMTTLLVYGIAAASWSIFISSFFCDPIFAISVGACLWIGSYILLAASAYNRLSNRWKPLLALFPNLALTFCAELLLVFDENLEEADWKILFTPKNDVDSFTIGLALIEMLLSSVLYNLLAWYFESVIPTRLGASKPLSFILKTSFWKNLRTLRSSQNSDSDTRGKVEMNHLKKEIGGKQIFQCESTITIERRETTILWGPNGSGKTTLLKIMAGLVPPTGGTVLIGGVDVNTCSVNAVQKRLGYCPQSNTLFRDLTVEEHLIFFGRLGCLTKKKATEETKVLLKLLNLSEKANTLSRHLSEGQKRMLNLGMAAIGDPEVLLLDEPTSGVDMQSRSRVRQLLQTQVSTIIMTSHFREECRLGKILHFHEGRIAYKDLDKELDATFQSGNPSEFSVPKDVPGVKLTGLALLFQQFRALMWKRRLWTYREKGIAVVQVLLPILLGVFTMLCAQNVREGYSIATFSNNFGLPIHKKPVILYSTENGTHEMWNNFTVLRSYGAKEVTNVTEALVEAAERNPLEYMDRYFVAAEFGVYHFKAMYSQTQPQAQSSAINLASNAILRRNDAPITKRSEYINGSVNLLVPNWKSTELDAADPSPQFVTRVSLVVAAVLPTGLALLAASFVVMPVNERRSKVKQLQLMTGLNGSLYWSAHFCWDILVMAIVAGILVLCISSMGTYGLCFDRTGEVVLFAMLMTYGFAATFFSYLVSTKFENASKAFSVVMILHIISGTIGPIALKAPGLSNFASIASLLLRIMSPTFGLSLGLTVFSEIFTLNSRCNSISKQTLTSLCNPNNTFDLRYRSCCTGCQIDFPNPTCFEPQPYIQWNQTPRTGHTHANENGIGFELVLSCMFGAFYMLFLAVIECQFFDRITRTLAEHKKAFYGSYNSQRQEPAGNGVSEPRTPAKDGIDVENLSKSYKLGEVISEFNLHVPAKECLGLAGPIGSGKSTLFRVVTGDELPTRGGVFIEGDNLVSNSCGINLISKQRLAKIGYCPLHEGLIDALTGKEMLELFARLRGRRWRSTSRIAAEWIVRLGLVEHEGIRCGKYSGGTQRRLSVALTLIGHPTVLILDEPIAGVDPESRQPVLRVIQDYQKAVVIATHDLTDCETIISRLAIVKNGHMVDSGLVGDLKIKYLDRIEVAFNNLQLGLVNLLLQSIIREVGGVVESVWKNDKLWCYGMWIVNRKATIGTPYRQKLKEKLQMRLEKYVEPKVNVQDDKTLGNIYLSLVTRNTPESCYESDSRKHDILSAPAEFMQAKGNLLHQFREEIAKYSLLEDKGRSQGESDASIIASTTQPLIKKASLGIKISNYMSCPLTSPDVQMYCGEKRTVPDTVSSQTAEWFEAESDGSQCCLLLSVRMCETLRLTSYCYMHVDGYIYLYVAFTPSDVPTDNTRRTILCSFTPSADAWSSGWSSIAVEGLISSSKFLAKASMTPGSNAVVTIEIMELHGVKETLCSPIPTVLNDKRKEFKDLYYKHMKNIHISDHDRNVVVIPEGSKLATSLSVKLTNYLTSSLTVQGRWGNKKPCSLADTFEPVGVARCSTLYFRFKESDFQGLLSVSFSDGTSLILFAQPRTSGVVLIGGFCPVDEPKMMLDKDYEMEDILRSLPFDPDLFQAPFESFLRHGKFLARVGVAPANGLELYIDVVEIPADETVGGGRPPPEAESRTLPPNEPKLNGNVSYHHLFLSMILADLEKEQQCVALIIDLENRLNVSIREHSTEGKNPNMHPFSHQGLDVPAEVLASTRETFYQCSDRCVEAMFSYKLDLTDLILMVAFEVQGDENAFSVALVPPTLAVSKDSMMDPAQLRIHPYRVYANASDGEQVIQDRDIRVKVNMTKGSKSILTLCIFTV